MLRWVVVMWLVACGSSGKTPPPPTTAVKPARMVVEVAAGDDHTCARMSDRSVWCWGEGEDGQIGVEVHARAEPAEVASLAGASLIAAGGRKTCGLFGGEVRCLDGAGALTTPKPLVGAAVSTLVVGLATTCAAIGRDRVRCFDRESSEDVELADVVEIGVDVYERCARTRSGEIACWPRAGAPVRRELAPAVSLAAGWQHMCVAHVDGTVLCWGTNTDHQLGNPNSHSDKPVVVPGITDAVEVVSGMHSTCARHKSGQVTCWGDLVQPWGAPAKVATVTDAIALGAGDRHACAVLRDGSLTCWGDDADGQLGRRPFSVRTRSEAVPGLPAIARIASNGTRTCAIDRTQRVWCWETPAYDDKAGTVAIPALVPELAGALDLSLGYQQGCVIRGDRTLACWAAGAPHSPAAVPGLRDVDEVGVGYAHACARAGGTVRCWGSNGSGQLGDGTENDRPAPTVIPKLADATRLFVDGNSTCVARKGGAIPCFGGHDARDFTGALIVAGAYTSAACKLLAAGTVTCTGYNAHGELGNGTIDYHQKPDDWVDAVGLSDVVDLSTSLTRACAVKRDGTLWCWGNVSATFGLASSRKRDCNLGDGPPDPCVRAPTRVPEIANATRVIVESSSICALLADGSVRCWGRREAIGWAGIPDPFGPALVAFP
jgi:alpha-tubulin suppressor-like RCC1 family protein